MNITERLDRLRQDFPDCETVAYADLSTQMVLAWSARAPQRQEVLNALCADAVDMLDGVPNDALSDVLGHAEAAMVHQVILLDADQIGVFLRSTQSPFDALCCLCAPTVDTCALIAGARRHLDVIGADA